MWAFGEREFTTELETTTGRSADHQAEGCCLFDLAGWTAGTLLATGCLKSLLIEDRGLTGLAICAEGIRNSGK